MRLTCAVFSAILVAACASAQTVTVSLNSSQDGSVVAPGDTIDWTVEFSVSTGDNAGLALLSVDLQQDAANPEKFDIPPADGVPVAMSNFSRPAGISNPGELDPTTGYIGVLRGAAGEKNVVQMGGGQNTFGVAQPAGTGIAESATVVGGVGQSGTETLASGSFAAPATEGAYTFSLANIRANVLTSVNAPPDFSPVVTASVDDLNASFSFTVAVPQQCPNDPTGNACDTDIDGDCVVNNVDLGVLLAAYLQTSADPGYNPAADFDGSGEINNIDLGEMLADYLNDCN